MIVLLTALALSCLSLGVFALAVDGCIQRVTNRVYDRALIRLYNWWDALRRWWASR